MPMSMFCFIDNNFHDVWLGFLRPGDIQNRDMTLTGLEHPQFFNKMVCETRWFVYDSLEIIPVSLDISRRHVEYM